MLDPIAMFLALVERLLDLLVPRPSPRSDGSGGGVLLRFDRGRSPAPAARTGARSRQRARRAQ